MIGTLMQRMLFLDLVRVFALALLAITGLFVIAGLIAEATQRGLAPTQVLAVIPLLIPNTFPYTLPAATLFATCVVYGRLAADNEAMAFRSSGAKLVPLAGPALALGLAASATTFALAHTYIPTTHRILRTQIVGDVEDLLYNLLKRNGCLRHPQIKYSMWVRDVQGRHLLDAVFKQRQAQGGYDVVARAREAEIRFDPRLNLIRVEMPHCVVTGENDSGRATIGPRTWEVPLPENFLHAEYPNRPSDLTWPQLFERAGQLRAEAEEFRRQIDSPPEAGIATPAQAVELEGYRRSMIRQRQREIRCLEAEVQQRPSLALGCVCFVLIGCPVGLVFGRSDYLSAFVTCFLPTIFLYYPLFLAGTNLVKDGIAPVSLVWLANGVTGTIGLILCWRVLGR